MRVIRNAHGHHQITVSAGAPLAAHTHLLPVLHTRRDARLSTRAVRQEHGRFGARVRLRQGYARAGGKVVVLRGMLAPAAEALSSPEPGGIAKIGTREPGGTA